MRTTQAKDTMSRLVDARRHDLARYHAQGPDGRFLHMSGQGFTDNPEWYWRGSYTQFKNLNLQHGNTLRHINWDKMGVTAYTPTSKENL